MPLFRRAGAGPAPQFLSDQAMGNDELARVRDLVVSTGQWEPAAELLRATEGHHDRRASTANALAAAAVQPAPWLDAWAAAEPSDPGVHLVMGWTSVQRAWEARGAGAAKHTGESAFEAFFRLLEDAVPECREATRLAPEDPTPWVVRLWLGIGRQSPREKLDEVWAQTVARDPLNRAGHIARLQTVSQKWYGSHEEMYDFARSTTEPSWAPVLPLQAHAEFVLQEQDERGFDEAAFWRGGEVSTDLDRALFWATGAPLDDPYALHDLTVVGYCLSRAERWEQAATVFGLSGHRAFEYPWYYRMWGSRAFSKAHKRALGATG